jgi:hypothetical protein
MSELLKKFNKETQQSRQVLDVLEKQPVRQKREGYSGRVYTKEELREKQKKIEDKLATAYKKFNAKMKEVK